MLVHVFLPALLVRLLLDTRKPKTILDAEGNPYNAFLSPWRFFAVKRCKNVDQDGIFLVRFFKGRSEWSVQFENVTKGYSFGRYCESPTPKALYRVLRLLRSDAKFGFDLPF